MIPDDAQYSDDGQWWWDGQDWQPVESDVDVDAGAGQALFDFTDLGIHVEGEDKSRATAGEALRAGFTLRNVGTVPAFAQVVVHIDGQEVLKWDSPEEIWPEPTSYVPNGDGYVSGVLPQAAGSHKLEAWVTPQGPDGYSWTNLDL